MSKNPYAGLTPLHRPYQGGRALVDLLHDVGSHKAGRYWCSRISPAQVPMTLRYAKNDAQQPNRRFHVAWHKVRVAEYDFTTADGRYRVVVYDDTGRPWGGGVRFRVTDLKGRIRRGTYGEVSRDTSHGGWNIPRVSFGGPGYIERGEAVAYIDLHKVVLDLVNAEAAYQFAIHTGKPKLAANLKRDAYPSKRKTKKEA